MINTVNNYDISVIIPTYGDSKYLIRAIESVLNQTINNFELIIVDDNGLNTEYQIKNQTKLQKYIDNNKIKYIAHTVNQNGAKARNTGFDASTGSYIALLDDDDEYTPNHLEDLYNALLNKNNEYGIAFCTYYKYNKDGTLFSKVNAKKSGYILYNVLMHRPSLTSGSLLIKREVWQDMGGFDESFKRHQDWEFTARIVAKYKVVAVNKLGLIKHLEMNNKPKDINKIYEYRLKYLDKISEQIMLLPKYKQNRVKAENLCDISMQYLKCKDLKSFVYSLKSFKLGFYSVDFLFRRMYFIMEQKIKSRIMR